MLCFEHQPFGTREEQIATKPSGADDNRIISADSLITTDARLDSLYQTLPEVMITGERPTQRGSARRWCSAPAPPYPEPPRR